MANAEVSAPEGAHDGRHRPEVPHQLTEIYIKACDQVGNICLASDFWRARKQLHAGYDQPLRVDGAGVWTPDYSAVGRLAIDQRVQELMAGIKKMSYHRRSAASCSMAASFASAMMAVAPLHCAHSPHLRKPKSLLCGRDRVQRAQQIVAKVPPGVTSPSGLGATQVEPDYFEDYFED